MKPLRQWQEVVVSFTGRKLLDSGPIIVCAGVPRSETGSPLELVREIASGIVYHDGKPEVRR